MEPGTTKKERYLVFNTLVSLVMATKGRQVTVDLRNGASVTGKVIRCDAFMNVDIAHALFRDASGKPHIFEHFFINKRNIRYVHIPPQIDMRKAVEKFLEGSRVKMMNKPDSFKMRRVQREQAQTLEHIRKLKEHQPSKEEEEDS